MDLGQWPGLGRGSATLELRNYEPLGTSVFPPVKWVMSIIDPWLFISMTKSRHHRGEEPNDGARGSQSSSLSPRSL